MTFVAAGFLAFLLITAAVGVSLAVNQARAARAFQQWVADEIRREAETNARTKPEWAPPPSTEIEPWRQRSDHFELEIPTPDGPIRYGRRTGP